MARPPLLRVPELVKARNNQNEIQTWLEVFRRLNELIDGDGLPEFIAAINTLGTYPALLAALAPTLADISDAGTAAAGDIGTDVQAYAAALAQLSGLTLAQGDLLYRNASQLTNLAKGTAGQVLTMNAGATAPEWAAASGGSYSVVGGWQARMSANKSINNNTTTAINTWNTYTYDTGSILSGTLTDLPTTSGATHALVVFQGRFASDATGRRNFYIQYGTAGGTSNTYIGLDGRNAVSGPAVCYATVMALFEITGGTDEISFSVFQNSGAALNLESNFTHVTAEFRDYS